ncbi:tyrosine-type recombinase/integrase [Tunturibacter empetritectus]|uniref:tyrosine-type recombinase/integrase n=1 Tax=Tunturiibacter empetritectus TaxID=3069691 RepID=UPI001C848E4F|nr:tyrosine-type recombinase/integrase [Edaphobacter lichenicola]
MSKRHLSDYLINKYLTDCCGPFRELVDEYLNGFATLHYENLATVRTGLGPFFLFLNEQGIASLEDVAPKTVTQYLVWAEKSGRRGAIHDISVVLTFFKWMIAEGRRKAGNPVVGLIHNQRKKRRSPRPYANHEIDFIWKLLRERGNSRLRLAAAIAEEAGLRISEICRLRVADIDMVQQRIFVGLPTKTKRERLAFFSHKTAQCCDAWMRERDPECGHDYLFYNTRGNMLTCKALADEFKRVLCTTYRGKKVNDTGLDRWSTHRLRHTMATNLVSGGADAATVMAAGGWVSFDSMAGYAQVDPAVSRRGYQEAMRVADEQKQSVPRTKSLTPAELLKWRQVTAVKSQLVGVR